MKVLIVALNDAVRDALKEQFDVRDRFYESVCIDDLCPPITEGGTISSVALPADITCVVNFSTIELAQEGRSGDGPLQQFLQLARACSLRSVPLVQLSSAQVFDDVDGGRHREDDDVSLSNSDLGSWLVEAEQAVLVECKQHIILRTGPLFSAEGDNLLTRLLDRFDQGVPLSLSSKGKACPLHVRDLARVISAIIDQLSCGGDSWGIYHYSSTEPVSSYQFAEAVLAVVSQYTEATEQSLLLDPVDEADSDWQAPMLNCEKILFTFGIKQLPWRVFITPTIKAVFEEMPKEVGSE